MKTGNFAIDYTGNTTTVGSAELRVGVIEEIGAELTILAGDGEEYSRFWLRADLVEHRIEYLYFAELEGVIVRAGTWPIDDVDEGGWEPSGDERALLFAFDAMVEVATDLRIRPLTRGMEVDNLGSALDQETSQPMVAVMGLFRI